MWASGHGGLFCSLCPQAGCSRTTPGGAPLLDFGGNGTPWWPSGGVDIYLSREGIVAV